MEVREDVAFDSQSPAFLEDFEEITAQKTTEPGVFGTLVVTFVAGLEIDGGNSMLGVFFGYSRLVSSQLVGVVRAACLVLDDDGCVAVHQ